MYKTGRARDGPKRDVLNRFDFGPMVSWKSQDSPSWTCVAKDAADVDFVNGYSLEDIGSLIFWHITE